MHKAISFVHVFKFIFENHYIIDNMEYGTKRLPPFLHAVGRNPENPV